MDVSENHVIFDDQFDKDQLSFPIIPTNKDLTDMNDIKQFEDQFYFDWFQIENKKLDWKVESRVGSLDNASHKAGGGDKKVLLVK